MATCQSSVSLWFAGCAGTTANREQVDMSVALQCDVRRAG